ncbi:MAG: NAD(P)/FAD-dependent oxidoreductase [Chitinophagales bacterium]
MNRKKVVIIGAGFGGLSLAKHLAHKNIDVLIIDKNNYHTFQPLLYQVATGGLEPDSIVYPIRRFLRGIKNIRFRMAEVTKIDQKNSALETNIGTITYDYLVIASGSTNNFFNFEPIKGKLLPLKGIVDALNIRSFLMQNLEKVLTLNSEKQAGIVNVAIIGGGPAGLEVAGALAEMKKRVLPKDFPEFDFDNMHIYLFEAADKLLGTMSSESSNASLKYIKELGVEVMLNAKVQRFDGHTVFLENGNTFQTETVIWTAGVKGATIKGLDKTNLVAGNRIGVNDYNQVLETANVFAIGDIAAKIDETNPKGLPMLAQVAIQQGKHLAHNLLRLQENKSMQTFKYHNKGTMATIGKNKAVVDLPKWKFQGRFAWFVWMFIHLISLIGFRNKIVTLVDWIQNYISYDRPLGIIIRKYERKS